MVIKGKIWLLVTMILISANTPMGAAKSSSPLGVDLIVVPDWIYLPGIWVPDTAKITLKLMGGAGISGIDIMLVIDRSGSMSGVFLADAKAAASHFCDNLDPVIDQSGLVSFSSSATLDRHLSIDHNATKAAVNRLSAGGGTAIGAGITVAQSGLTGPHARPDALPVMILLSDGMSGDNPIPAATAAKNAGTIIYTIALGAGADQATLKAIASDPWSQHFFYAPTGSDLDSIYQGIYSGVSATGYDIVITKILGSDVSYIGSGADPMPDSIRGDKLYWSTDSIVKGDTLTYTFNIRASRSGRLPVSNPNSEVICRDRQGNSQVVAFPEEYINVYGLLVETDQSDTVDPGEEVYYTLTVSNYACSSDTINITTSGTIPTWTVELYQSDSTSALEDHNGDLIPDVILSAYGDSTDIVVKITSPYYPAMDAEDTTIVTATSSETTGLLDSASLRTQVVVRAEIAVTPDQDKHTEPGSSVYYELQIVNNGNAQDSISLISYYTFPEWSVEIYDKDTTTRISSVVLAPGGTEIIIVKITSEGDKSDTLLPGDSTYIMGRSSNIPTISDSALLVTKLHLVGNLIVEQDSSLGVDPGETASYTIWVRNLGNFKDIIDLQVSHTQPDWGFDLPLIDNNGNGFIDVDSLSFPDSVSFTLKVTPPLYALADITDTTEIVVMYARMPGWRDTVTVITTVNTVARLIVDPNQIKTVEPGDTIFYKLRVINEGNARDSINLILDGTSQDFSVKLFKVDGITPLTYCILDPSEEREIFVRVTTTHAKSDTLQYTDSTYVIGTSSNVVGVSDRALLVTILNIVGEISIYSDSSGVVDPGDTILYTLWVQNRGNFKDIIDLRISHTQLDWGFDLSLIEDHNNNGFIDVDSLSPPDSVSFILKVTPPPNASADITDTTEIVAMYARTPETQDTVVLITRVARVMVDIDLDPGQERRVFPGQSIYYPLKAAQFSNFSDIINIETEESGNGWRVDLLNADKKPLFDSNHDGIMDIGRVASGMYRDLIVKITAPSMLELDTLSDINETIVYARSAFKSYVYDTVLLTTAIIWKLDIHNYASPFVNKTRFVIRLPERGEVDLTVYNRLGEKIKTVIDGKAHSRGIHFVSWEGINDYGRRVAPGVYIYLLEFRGESGSHRELMKKTAIIPEQIN